MLFKINIVAAIKLMEKLEIIKNELNKSNGI